MHRFIYISNAHAGNEFSTLADIQSVSNFCNARDSITGALLWADNAFFQLIEGPKSLVDAVVGRIYLDRRHSGMQRLSYRPISEPICVSWTMGCFPMSTSAFFSEMFDAGGIQNTFDRISAIPDLELDIHIHNFYDTNIRRT